VKLPGAWFQIKCANSGAVEAVGGQIFAFTSSKQFFVIFLQERPSLICFPLCWQINYFKDIGFTDGTVHEDERLQTTSSLTA
jgi:hypothetical protein